MEKGNQPESGSGTQVSTTGGAAGGGQAAGGGAAPAGGSPGGAPLPPLGTDTGLTGTPPPVAPDGGGGGSQADQSGPKRPWLDDLPKQEGEYPDGSILRYGEGSAEYQEGNDRARLEGNQWIDAKTGTPWEGEMAKRASARLADVEQQLRLNPPRR